MNMPDKIATLMIPGIDSSREVIYILRLSFLAIILRGLRTLSTLSTFIAYRSRLVNPIEIQDISTVKRSRLFQPLRM